jgi:hypothetical protein
MWDALRMDGVAHEPTTGLFVLNGGRGVLSMSAMYVPSLVERRENLTCMIDHQDMQSEKSIILRNHSLSDKASSWPGKALFGGRVLPGLRYQASSAIQSLTGSISVAPEFDLTSLGVVAAV